MTLVEQITKHLDIVSPVKENSLPGALYLRERKVTLKIAADIDSGKHTLESLKAERNKLAEDDSYSQFDGRNHHVFTSLEFVINWLEDKVEKQGQVEEIGEENTSPKVPARVIELANEICEQIAEGFVPYTHIQANKLFWMFAIEQRATGRYDFSQKFSLELERWKLPCHDAIAEWGLPEIRQLIP